MQVTGRVCHNVTHETATCTSAVAAEKDGFVSCLDKAKQDFHSIDTITTDGNISIRALMRKDQSGIKHGLDVWHICKNLSKNLANKATRKVRKWN